MKAMHGHKSLFFGKTHQAHNLLESSYFLNLVSELDHAGHGRCLAWISEDLDVDQEELGVVQVFRVKVYGLHVSSSELDADPVELVWLSPSLSLLSLTLILLLIESRLLLDEGFCILELHRLLDILILLLRIVLEVPLIDGEESCQLLFIAHPGKFV